MIFLLLANEVYLSSSQLDFSLLLYGISKSVWYLSIVPNILLFVLVGSAHIFFFTGGYASLWRLNVICADLFLFTFIFHFYSQVS